MTTAYSKNIYLSNLFVYNALPLKVKFYFPPKKIGKKQQIKNNTL